MTAITLANICPRCYHEHLYYNDEPCVSCECEYEVEEWLRIKLAEIQAKQDSEKRNYHFFVQEEE